MDVGQPTSLNGSVASPDITPASLTILRPVRRHAGALEGDTMNVDHGGAAASQPGTPGERGAEPGDAIDRVWGSAGPTGLVISTFIAAAFMLGGIVFAVTAYAPAEAEPATVVRQYFSSTGSGRSICGVEVQVASGEKGKAVGGNVCSAYDEGDQVVALVSTVTGDVVGVRHAGRDLGRAGNPMAGLVPFFAFTVVVSAFMAAGRRTEPGLLKMALATLTGGAIGLGLSWFLF